MAETKPKRTTPLSDTERLVIQNIFDTQPTKRAQYLKELGFQMNPKDENEYKPIGSSDELYDEIDPGFKKAFKKGGLSGLVNEMGLDIADLGFDVGVAGPAAAGGAIAGGAAGSVLPIIGTILGGVGGGAVGNYIAEEAKNAAANVLTDTDIPMDRRLTAVQSLLTGAVPAVMKGGVFATKAAWKKALEVRSGAIKRAIGSGLTNDMVEVIARDPEKYTVDAVKDANKSLLGTVRNIFGMDNPLKINSPDSIPNSGIFRDKINPLNEAANAQIEALSKDRSKDMSLAEVNKFMQDMIDKSMTDPATGNKMSIFELPEDSKRAVAYLKDRLKELKDEFKTGSTSKKIIMDGEEIVSDVPGLDPNQVMLPFDKVYNLGKRIQKDAHDFHESAPGSNILRSFTGGDPQGITKLLDAKALDLAKINQQRSKIMDAYNFASDKITLNNIGSFYTGKKSPGKEAVQEGLDAVDKALGTNLAKEVQTGGVQAFVEDTLNRSVNAGSKNMLALKGIEGVKGLAMGAGAGGAAGSLVGAAPAGAVLGGIAGVARGVNQAASFADPEYALKELLKAKTESAAVDPAVRALGVETLGTGLGAAAVGAKNEANLPVDQAQESDPWSVLDEPHTSPTQPAPSQSPAAPQADDPWSVLDQ